MAIAALIGPARVKDIIFTARLLGADERWLAEGGRDDLAALAQRTSELAKNIDGNAPLTIRATKLALARLQPRFSDDEGKDLATMCYMSGDFREGLDAFLNKRQPRWRGE